MSTLEDRLRAALPAAIRSGDAAGVAALRGAIAAIGNAEAVDRAEDHGTNDATTATSEHVAGASIGVGASEVARRELSDADVRGIVQAEVDSRCSDALLLEAHGQGERAERLRAEAAVLRDLLGGTS